MGTRNLWEQWPAYAEYLNQAFVEDIYNHWDNRRSKIHIFDKERQDFLLQTFNIFFDFSSKSFIFVRFWHRLKVRFKPFLSEQVLEMRFTEPWRKSKSKTMLARGDDVAVAWQQGVTDPIAMNHANINCMVPEAPLASYVDYPDRLDHPPIRLCLTKDKFLKCCNEIWEREDIQCFTGHSFCIGGTTHFLICGVNPKAVKSFGRWKSDTFHKYC
ncbi:hypothetical protein C8J56DRAFT_1056303 [Mycena floridula]|nr:hypothetical protein C8J56DRAFT_1056303 [Mycena floridula]